MTGEIIDLSGMNTSALSGTLSRFEAGVGFWPHLAGITIFEHCVIQVTLEKNPGVIYSRVSYGRGEGKK